MDHCLIYTHSLTQFSKIQNAKNCTHTTKKSIQSSTLSILFFFFLYDFFFFFFDDDEAVDDVADESFVVFFDFLFFIFADFLFSSFSLSLFNFAISLFEINGVPPLFLSLFFFSFFFELFCFDAFALFLLPSIIAEAVFIFLPLLRVENLLSKLLIRSFANIDIRRLFPITLFLCSSIFCFFSIRSFSCLRN